MVNAYLQNPSVRRILAVFLFVLSFGLVIWANYSTLASRSEGMASLTTQAAGALWMSICFPNIVALHWGLASKRGARWVWWAGWWLVGAVMSWVLFVFALQRGLDIVSSLMPLLSLGYLVLAWLAYRGQERKAHTPNDLPLVQL